MIVPDLLNISVVAFVVAVVVVVEIFIDCKYSISIFHLHDVAAAVVAVLNVVVVVVKAVS